MIASNKRDDEINTTANTYHKVTAAPKLFTIREKETINIKCQYENDTNI